MVEPDSGSGDGSLLIVICGPSGAGKGTIVEALVGRDPRLWVSRSWTTRPQRSGEPGDAYEFVDAETFDRAVAEDRFLEWAEVFGGHRYGTPLPDAPPGRDVVLEIDVQGAQQVRERRPDALVILVEPPSRAEQERRLLERADTGDQLAERLAKADAEEEVGRQLADAVVVNDDLDRAVAQVADIVDARRNP